MRLDACHATDRLYVERSDEHQNQGGDLRFDEHGFFVGLEILNDLTGCRLALTRMQQWNLCYFKNSNVKRREDPGRQLQV